MHLSRVRMFYLSALNREPDSRGEAHYLGKLERREMTPAQVLAEIMNSDEAKRRAGSFDPASPVFVAASTATEPQTDTSAPDVAPPPRKSRWRAPDGTIVKVDKIEDDVAWLVDDEGGQRRGGFSFNAFGSTLQPMPPASQ
ncbi:MAG: DUF4214 domain-containing protein [Pseudomonadota bacterium]